MNSIVALKFIIIGLLTYSVLTFASPYILEATSFYINELMKAFVSISFSGLMTYATN